MMLISHVPATTMDRETTSIGSCFLRPRSFMNQSSLLNHHANLHRMHDREKSDKVEEDRMLSAHANRDMQMGGNDTKMNGRSFQFQFISNVKMEVTNANSHQQEYIASKLMFGIGLLLFALFF